MKGRVPWQCAKCGKSLPFGKAIENPTEGHVKVEVVPVGTIIFCPNCGARRRVTQQDRFFLTSNLTVELATEKKLGGQGALVP